MMLFLFVLMLVGVDSADSLVETINGQRWIGLLAGLGLAFILVTVVTGVSFWFLDWDKPHLVPSTVEGATAPAAGWPAPAGLEVANTDGNPVGVARLVFGRYVFAFEIVGTLLVTAALGAILLTHSERLRPKATQRSLSEDRVRAGTHVPPLPAPGVFARHNAVDTPALLPDGPPKRAVGLASAAGPRPEPAGARRSGTAGHHRGCARRSEARGSRPRRDSGGAHRAANDGARPVRGVRAVRRLGGRCHETLRSGRERVPAMMIEHYLVLSAILFSIGATTVLVRRNAIVVFMGVELMLNASNLALVTFSRMQGNLSGQVIAFFVMVVAAAEVVVGLAIIVSIFRTRRSASVDDANLLKY